ncbi:MAG: 8-oxo-dGTP pyrophosphatase MutT (NUDIX family) [Enterobacterales bacterium]|jgi:8-oxo-dGTP pyrophosphatase MutT (NUDIX family)
MKVERITKLLPDLNQPCEMHDIDDHLKASAVLLILHRVDDNWHLLFTKRAEHLKHHPGQISFPGGRYEDDDIDLIDTAIRETEEEIGIIKQLPTVISQLENHPTLTGYRIYPFVALIEILPELIIDKGEVDDIFSVPLAYLMNKANQQLESVTYNNVNYDLYKIVWQDKLIWGATARMVVNLSNYISADELPHFEE